MPRRTVLNLYLLQNETSMTRTLTMPASDAQTLSLLAVIGLLNSMAMGAVPPQPTIDNPCRTSGSVSSEFPPLDSLLRDTIVDINGAKSSAQQMMTALQGDGFLTSTDITIVTGAYSHLPGLPLRVEADNPNLENMVNLMLQDYHDISVYIIFVKEALREQLAFDGGLLTNEISQLESSLFALLCKVDTLLKSKGATVSSFVDSSAMPDDIKNIEESTSRYQRNYILMKDARILLNHLAMNYASLLEIVQA